MKIEDINHSFHNNPQTHFKNALKFFENEQIPATLQSIDAAIVFSHHSPFYIYQKIRILYQLGALKSCSQLIIAQLNYLYKHGSLYLLCRSIDYLQKINHFTLGQLRYLLDQHDIPYCIADHYKSWLTAREKPIQALAENALRHDHFSLCLSYCHLYLKQAPLNASIAYMTGYCYRMLGDLSAAEDMYKQCLPLTTDSLKVKTELISLQIELHQFDTALSSIKELLASHPHHPDYLSYWGECLCLSQKFKQARRPFKKLSRKKPYRLQAYFNLAYIYGKLGRSWQAKHFTKKAERLLKHTL